MNAAELHDKFSQWNPMETDYKNADFNQYISGPGADLDAELQPAQQALQKTGGYNMDKKESQPVPTLVFKNLPKDMTRNAMRNICSRHGAVREVRDSTKNAFYFVDMNTVADMEAVFRALENNNYGFKIMVGKNINKREPDVERSQGQQNFSYVPPSNTGIDYQSRKYRTSNKSHPRPKVREESVLNATDVATTGLPLNILTNDAHSLERQGFDKMEKNNNFNYRHGRSYISMPEKMKLFIDKKHKESSGAYNDTEDKYIHTLESGQMPNLIAKCSKCYYTCDTVCERCDQYYCSVECQKEDWPDHRYICGKPKHMQKTPPSKKGIQSNYNSSKISKEYNERAIAPTTSNVVEEITMKKIVPEQLLQSSKAAPKQIRSSHNAASLQLPTSSKTSKEPSKKLPAILRTSLKPHPNSLVNTLQQLPVSSKISQEPLNSSKKLPAALRTSFNQLSNSSVETPQQFLTSSKPSSKKLPAALRAFHNELSNSLVEASQKFPTSRNGSPQQLSKSSAVSQNNSNKKFESTEDIYKQNMPRSGNIVTITAICKANVVFIRSTTYDANLSYFNTIDSLQSLGRMLKPLKNLPNSGEMVIAKFEGQFNRALVLKAFDDKNILIHFMDYGNMEEAKMEELFEAPKELVYKPRHAIPVLLKDVADCYMTQEIRKFMHSYLNNINVEIRYKPEDFHQGNNVYAVELIDENTQQNLNKMITKLSKPVEPQNSNEICDKDYLEKKTLPVGKNVELIVMDNSLMCSGCISCTTKLYAIEIDKFKEDIQAYIESIPKEAYTPRVHELCIARYAEDGLWYRGLCLETVGDGYPSIHFIDYGNITMIPIESIRRYPRQFTYPIYTVDCTIEGLPEFCDDELVAKLEDIIPNGELIKCENVTFDEDFDFYTLSVPKVIRELNTH